MKPILSDKFKFKSPLHKHLKYELFIAVRINIETNEFA